MFLAQVCADLTLISLKAFRLMFHRLSSPVRMENVFTGRVCVTL